MKRWQLNKLLKLMSLSLICCIVASGNSKGAGIGETDDGLFFEIFAFGSIRKQDSVVGVG